MYDGSRPIKKILIIGFGRMGVSHTFQILGALKSECELVVVDPSISARALSKILLPRRRFFRRLSDCQDLDFDIGVLCSPPYERSAAVSALERRCEFSLIEKPVLTELRSSTMSGYVMQYCPTGERVARNIATRKIKLDSIAIKVESNVDFSRSRYGWRTSPGAGGLASEFLGHALTFALTPIFRGVDLNFSDFKVKKSSANLIDITISVDDLKIHCVLIADAKVRKTRYSCLYSTECGEIIEFDPYQIKEETRTTSITEIAPDIEYFLRSYEFSTQCERLLSNRGDFLTAKSIVAIEALIAKIK